MHEQLTLGATCEVDTSTATDAQRTSCPYCTHRAGLHAGPGATASEPGTCHEAGCDCPGWHPARHPESCGSCGDGTTDLWLLEGYATWRCSACLDGWSPPANPRTAAPQLLAACLTTTP